VARAIGFWWMLEIASYFRNCLVDVHSDLTTIADGRMISFMIYKSGDAPGYKGTNNYKEPSIGIRKK
jgi:hypothetical protein